MKRKVILYIAMSLDGYIAKDEDNIDFLNVVEAEGEDYGHSDFIKNVDTLIWGRKTYDKVLSFGIDFPYKDKQVYVLSGSKTGSDENVTYINDVKALLSELKEKEEGKNIYIDGGGGLVYELLKDSLIDKFIISVIPHLIGHGKRLFHDNRPEEHLKLTHSSTYASGLVQLWYDKISKP